MINTLERVAVRCLLAAVMSVVAVPAFAQPTEAQREAVKTDCQSDYIAHCSSVPPGGEAALQCLAKNMSSLSSTCQAAVRAVEASVAKPATAPAATNAKPAAPTAPAAAPKAAATTTAKQPSSAQVSAIRAACQSDYPKVCAGVPSGGAAALQCLDKNKAKVSAGCQQAVNAATGGGAAPAAGGAAAAAAAATAQPAPLVLRKMLPREELFVARSACAADIGTLCQGVAPGGGRIMQCLSARSASLSPACRDVLVPFSVQ
jgi:hypothetical protein